MDIYKEQKENTKYRLKYLNRELGIVIFTGIELKIVFTENQKVPNATINKIGSRN